MDIIQFVPEELFIVVAVLYGVGMLLKKTPKVADWCIPWLLMVVGIVFSVLMQEVSPEAILQGILCSFCAVGTNQLFKQYSLKDKK